MRRISLTLFVFFLNFPALADDSAHSQAVQFKGQYDCSLSGIAFAQAGIEADQTATHVDASGDIVLSGIVSFFVKHSSHTTVKETGNDFTYPDIIYESHYKTNDKPRYVSMRHHNGELSDETLVPPENHQKRPEVPQSLKGTAADPLTLVLKMRSMLIGALKKNDTHYRIDVYDGRRLNQVDFQVMGKRSLHVNDTDTPVIVVMARRKLIAGFTKSEIDSHDSDEPPLYIYFTDDARLWPVRFEAHMTFGTMAITLNHECAASESCLLGISN